MSSPTVMFPLQLPPEFELLLCCFSPSGRTERVRALLERGVNWPRLTRLAEYHKVVPHLYGGVCEAVYHFVPDAALRQLRDQFRANARRNLFLTARLLKLLTALDAEGVQAVPFKGPLLALSAYGDTAMRQFSDLDLLVRPESVPRARGVLIKHGYSPQFSLTDREELMLVKSRNEHMFSHDGEGVVVDLHWALAPRWLNSDTDSEGVWSRLGRTTVAGRKVPSLAEGDVLLFLCVHGSKHCWSKLSMIYDLATLLRTTAPDWAALSRQADGQGSTRMLHLGLHMASTLFGVELPAEVSKSIEADSTVHELAAESYAKMIRDPDEEWGVFEESGFNVRLIEKRPRKALFCIDMLLTPTPLEWEYVRLPDRLSFLYYLVRPFRLALKHGRGHL